jgi:hypothetical protein
MGNSVSANHFIRHDLVMDATIIRDVVAELLRAGCAPPGDLVYCMSRDGMNQHTFSGLGGAIAWLGRSMGGITLWCGDLDVFVSFTGHTVSASVDCRTPTPDDPSTLVVMRCFRAMNGLQTISFGTIIDEWSIETAFGRDVVLIADRTEHSAASGEPPYLLGCTSFFAQSLLDRLPMVPGYLPSRSTNMTGAGLEVRLTEGPWEQDYRVWTGDKYLKPPL